MQEFVFSANVCFGTVNYYKNFGFLKQSGYLVSHRLRKLNLFSQSLDLGCTQKAQALGCTGMVRFTLAIGCTERPDFDLAVGYRLAMGCT